MTVADWIICALVLLNVVTAAMQGFFSEALTMAGLVVGYIVAAWKYRGLAERLGSFFENEWFAGIVGCPFIFFAIVVVFGPGATNSRWGVEETRLSGLDPFPWADLG